MSDEQFRILMVLLAAFALRPLHTLLHAFWGWLCSFRFTPEECILLVETLYADRSGQDVLLAHGDVNPGITTIEVPIHNALRVNEWVPLLEAQAKLEGMPIPVPVFSQSVVLRPHFAFVQAYTTLRTKGMIDQMAEGRIEIPGAEPKKFQMVAHLCLTAKGKKRALRLVHRPNLWSF